MPNLTISIDDQLLKQARIRVSQQGTSLSAKVRELLLQYVSGTDEASRRQQVEATANLMSVIENATRLTQPPTPSALSTQLKTLREELYEGDFRARDRARLL
jgi:plasmid stability protein